MEIFGSVQNENVEVRERDRVQRFMTDFLRKMHKARGWDSEEISYRVQFWRPFFGAKVDALIEFRVGSGDAWFARANAQDPWRAFSRAISSLQQIVNEMDLRKDHPHASDQHEVA